MNRDRLPTQMAGAVLLNGYPGERVVIACERCNRRGEYAIESLYAQHGNVALPVLKLLLANCPRAKDMSDPCQAHFPALKPPPGTLDRYQPRPKPPQGDPFEPADW
jgi:hypothetical protein